MLFQHSIIAQPPPGGNEIDLPKEHDDGGGEGTGQPGECEIWKLTQQINWTPPSINTVFIETVGVGTKLSASDAFTIGQTVSNMKIYVSGFLILISRLLLMNVKL